MARKRFISAPLALGSLWLLMGGHMGCGDNFSTCESTRSCPSSTGGNAGEANSRPEGGSAGSAGANGDEAGAGGLGAGAGASAGENAGGQTSSSFGGASNGSTTGGRSGAGGTSSQTGEAGASGDSAGGAPSIPTCGDGHLDEGESCDDSNRASGDGCSSSCRSEAIDIQLGENFACALLGDGRLKCWGLASFGQLGMGDLVSRGDEPGEMGEALPTTLRDVTQFVTGRAHSCAVSLGKMYCWGNNRAGQLGLAVTSETPILAPAPVEFSLGADVRAMSASGDFTCALLVNGSVKCWGDNSNGVLGVDSSNAYEPFVRGQSLQAIDFGEKAVSVAAGRSFACAALESGKVKCWGTNERGSLGLGVPEGTLASTAAPTDAVDLGPNFSVSSVTAGISACALAPGGGIKCWGNASSGLGYENNVSLGTDPAQMGVALPTVPLGSSVKQVVAGWYEICVVLSAGGVECYGGTTGGMLGVPGSGNVGDSAGEMATLKPLPLGARARVVRIGRDAACALLENGDVKCWGLNTYGQLGQGNTENIGDSEGETAALPPVSLD